MAKQTLYFTMDEQELNERYATIDKIRREVGWMTLFGTLLLVMVGIVSYSIN